MADVLSRFRSLGTIQGLASTTIVETVIDGLIVNTALWPIRLALGLPFLFAFWHSDFDTDLRSGDLHVPIDGRNRQGLRR